MTQDEKDVQALYNIIRLTDGYRRVLHHQLEQIECFDALKGANEFIDVLNCGIVDEILPALQLVKEKIALDEWRQEELDLQTESRVLQFKTAGIR